MHVISFAQDLNYAKHIIADLCSEKMSGRGYVDDGVNKAAVYLEEEFKRLKLKKFGDSYSQSYSFSVNTIPGPILCKGDQQEWKAGIDFLIDAGSPSIAGQFRLLKFSGTDSLDLILLRKKIKQGFAKDEALVLRHTTARASHILDTCKLYQHLPACIIFTEDKKLTHTIASQVNVVASMIIWDSLLAEKESIQLNFTHQLIPNFTCKNLAAYVKGKNTDSMIVFTAHYDHLGKQGPQAMFPGANDNASGVSMILYLANYFFETQTAVQYRFCFIQR